MNKSEKAFQRYLADPVVQAAVELDTRRGKTLTHDLLRDCFLHGAKYATERCEAEHHTHVETA